VNACLKLSSVFCGRIIPQKSSGRKAEAPLSQTASHGKYKRTFAPSTVNRYLQVLSRILSMAYENSFVATNPMSRVKLLKEPEPGERYLNQYANEEEERLMKDLAASGEHLVALAELDLEVGMRPGELLKAIWGAWMRLINSSPSRRLGTTGSASCR
jgi:integrase